MTAHILLVAHIAVLGYWLGSELVINSEYRFICFRDDLPFAARDALTHHLMDVDQHVRYALIFQLTLGSMLASNLGLFPNFAFWLAPILGACWLALVELVHCQRKTELGQKLARLDRGIRYGVLAGLVAIALGIGIEAPLWLRLKLVAFSGVMACGVAIRFWLIDHFKAWAEMARDGPTAAGNVMVKQIYRKATATLILLWIFIGAAVLFSLWKP